MSESAPKKAHYRPLLGKLNRFDPGTRRLFELAISPSDLQTSLLQTFAGEPLDRREIQTYPAWKVQRSFTNLNLRQRKRSKQRTVYILPIGPFPPVLWKRVEGLEISILELMSKFVGVFFNGMTVKLMDEVLVTQLSCSYRFHAVTRKFQLLVTDLLSYLKACLPADGFCIVGLTWVDLYPGDEWNFVLGESSCLDGCAAVSFGHFELQSYQDADGTLTHNDGTSSKLEDGIQLSNVRDDVPSLGEEENKIHLEDFANMTEVDKMIIWRLLRVTSHEICHVFGMAHCSYFACAMNESKSILEAENQPLFLCPVCLRKLEKALGFDIAERYKALYIFLISLHNRETITGEDIENSENCPQCANSTDCRCKYKLSLLWLKSVLKFIENKGSV